MLFTSYVLGELALKNRIVMAPMCMYSAGSDGKATDWHVLHYATRAMGQVGLVIVEATGVAPGGRISNKDLGLWEDAQIPSFSRIVDAVHAAGGKIAVQLNHAGRKSEVPDTVLVAPSSIAFSDQRPLPHSLTAEEIVQVIEQFQSAAVRAVKAGVDAIEIHGAHGYLINQFLSPLANRREDQYGGSAENCSRLLGEVITAVRAVIPAAMPLTVRVSASDYEPGGNTPETVAAMINLVKQTGINAIHVSSGAVTPTVPPVYPGYQIGFAAAIKEWTGLPVIGGGLITTARQAQQIVRANVDLVFLARELLRNPYWPLHAARELGADISWPGPYERAK